MTRDLEHANTNTISRKGSESVVEVSNEEDEVRQVVDSTAISNLERMPRLIKGHLEKCWWIVCLRFERETDYFYSWSLSAMRGYSRASASKTPGFPALSIALHFQAINVACA